MNVFLWIVQVVLAAGFALSGLVKLTQPKGRYPWMNDVSAGMVGFIGVMEVLGAIGLLVPVVTPLAASGLAVMMALAVGLHVRRREPSGVAVTAVLLVLTALVAWGRF